MTMLEKIAMRIFRADQAIDPSLPERHFKVAISQYLARARAAVEAMREPNEEISSDASRHSPGAAIMTAWRDISTAPKDGTRILLTAPYGDVPGNWIGVGAFYCAAWRDDRTYVLFGPTHWMPLPPPPKSPTAPISEG